MIKKLELNLSDYFFGDIIETKVVRINWKNNNFHVNLNLTELKKKILNGEHIHNYNSIIKILKIYNKLNNKNINIEKLLNKLKKKNNELEKNISIIEKKVLSKIIFSNTNYLKIGKSFYFNIKNESFEFVKPNFNSIKNNNIIIFNKNILNSLRTIIKYNKNILNEVKSKFRYIFLNNYLQKFQLFTKSILIIAPIFSIELLKIILLNYKKKIIIIKSKQDFIKYKNKDILNSDYVIINYKIFDSKYFDNNVITNKLLINKLIIMLRNKNIKEKSIKNFHLFYWKRIIFYNIDSLISKQNHEYIYKDKDNIYDNIYWLSSNIKYCLTMNITNNIINKLISFNDYLKFKYKNQKENINNYNYFVKKLITKKFLLYNSNIKEKNKYELNNKIIYSKFSYNKNKIYKLLNLLGENINNINSFISTQDNFLLNKIIKSKEYINKFIERYTNKNIYYNKECPICLKEIKNNRIVLYCGHTLCLSCFIKSLENNINNCCLCRKDYKNNKFFLMDEESKKRNDKFEKVLNFIEKKKKYIIFSNFSLNLGKLSKFLKKHSKIKVYKYNNYNMSSFEKFNIKKEGILLIEKKFFFENMFIENINKVILLDPYIKTNNLRNFERRIIKNIKKEDNELIYFLVKNSDEEKYYNKNIKIENIS